MESCFGQCVVVATFFGHYWRFFYDVEVPRSVMGHPVYAQQYTALTDTSRVMLILKNAEKVTLHGFVCCFGRIVFFIKKNAKMIFS